LDYNNQRFHGLLDRRLAIDILGYILDGTLPSLSAQREKALLDRLQLFVTQDSHIELMSNNTHGIFAVVELADERKTIVKPVHTLSTGSQECRLALVGQTGIVAFVSALAIELERQPFGVWQQIIEESR